MLLLFITFDVLTCLPSKEMMKNNAINYVFRFEYNYGVGMYMAINWITLIYGLIINGHGFF